MKETKRPPFIMAFTGDTQGCGYHRLVSPANFLNGSGLAHMLVSTEVWDPSWFAAIKPDVVVWQRYVEKPFIDLMRKSKEAYPAAFHVYEIDDLLTEVPKKNYHSSFIPTNIEDRIREAMEICDAASVTTKAIRDWLVNDKYIKDVRIVPNFMPLKMFQERPQSLEAHKGKCRVGWAGGASHGGDLEVIREAMEIVGDKVEWVFFGMHPHGKLPVPVEFHPAVPINQYFDKFRSLNLDVVLAPLEVNRFNECKSNLRLIEAAAVGAMVIAQDIPSYKEDAPPALFATTAKEWAAAILATSAKKPENWRKYGARMQQWAIEHYSYEKQHEARIKAWLPKDVLPWRPILQKSPNSTVVACLEPHAHKNIDLSGIGGVRFVRTLAEAADDALKTGADVLWMRPGTRVTKNALGMMKAALIEKPYAAAVPLASDGPGSFPRTDTVVQVHPERTQVIDALAREMFPGKRGFTGVAMGPCALLSGSMIRRLGAPDEAGFEGQAELAILEWSARATALGIRTVHVLDCYVGSMAPQANLTTEHAMRIKARQFLEYMQMPVTSLSDAEREALELAVLKKEWAGIFPGSAGLPRGYIAWQALMPVPNEAKGGIVKQTAYGDPVDTSYPWILFYDAEDTVLRDDATAIFEKAIADNPDANFLYADHELETKDGTKYPYFKGHKLDPILLCGSDYITPVCAIRSALAHGVYNKSDALYAAYNSDPVHVPYVAATVKELSPEKGKLQASITAQFAKETYRDITAEPHSGLDQLGYCQLSFIASEPPVTLIVHSTGDEWALQPCLSTIKENTIYQNYKVVVVESKGETVSELDEAIRAENGLVCVITDAFRAATSDWLSRIVKAKQAVYAGVVSPRILHMDATLLHVGVAVVKGIPALYHTRASAFWMGYFGLSSLPHFASAATRECMLFDTKDYVSVGGFDKKFTSDLFDVDFCLRLGAQGKNTLIDCGASVQHMAAPANWSVSDSVLFHGKHVAYVDPWVSEHFLPGNNRDMGFEVLAWTNKPAEDAPRVLLINDATSLETISPVMEKASKSGCITYRAVLDGFNLLLVAPAPFNTKAWDIREPNAINGLLKALAIDRVSIGSLIGPNAIAAGVESIRLFTSLDVDVDFLGDKDQVLCPRQTMKINGVDCGEGWKKGPDHCQACVDKHGSPFGLVDVGSWLTAWEGFIRKSYSKAA